MTILNKLSREKLTCFRYPKAFTLFPFAKTILFVVFYTISLRLYLLMKFSDMTEILAPVSIIAIASLSATLHLI